jgi:hypothetical protein
MPLWVLLVAASAGALDAGLAVSQEAKASSEASAGSSASGNGDPVFFYSPVFAPWVSGVPGRSVSFYLSGSVTLEYEEDSWRTPLALPELTRTELTWLPSPAVSFTLGRQHFADPSALAASGLFDGLSAAFAAGGGRFTAGAYYTGLLYKHTADILMTDRDRAEHGEPFSLDEGYFASRRLLVSLQWEHPGPGPASSLALGLLGQGDLNGGESGGRLHSQYLSVRYGLRLPKDLSLEGAAVLGAGETGGDMTLFFAASLGFGWDLPGSPDDTLSLRGVYSSPRTGDRLDSFVPVNALPQGQVFTPAIGGVSAVKLGYTLRPLRTLSLGAEGSYFIRTDTETFRDTRNTLTEGYFLGGELFGAGSWTPLPDLALTFGGGAFFPRLGNAFASDAEIRWKTALRLILSL